MRKLSMLVVALALVAIACGDDTQRGAGAEPAPAGEHATEPGDTPPPGDATEEESMPPSTFPTSGDAYDAEDDDDDGRTERPVSDTSEPDRGLGDKQPERVPSEAVSPPPVVGEVPREYLEPVLADAAGRSGVEASALEIVRAQAMMWNDGALGCPRPGEAYIQVITPGYWVVLDTGEGTLDYRLDDGGFFKLCEGAQLSPPSSAPDS